MVDNKELAEKLGISGRTHFLGFRQDIPRILKTIDIVVLSSHWEGLSLASIEGLASGKPFIASRVPGLEEVVKSAGILFEQGDEIALVEIINRLFSDKVKYDEISNKCIIESRMYSIKNMMINVLNVYSKNKKV
jgi:hypothetical protein